jgi:hypothetical protein
MIANEQVFAIVPPFRYEPPALELTVAGQLGNFRLLTAWLALAVALAMLATRRMSLERS